MIPFHDDGQRVIRRAVKGDARAQQCIFESYAPRMLAVCRRYIGDWHFAEDTLVNGFVKVFDQLSTFRGDGSFEGWVRRIMVNECIAFLRKRQFVVFDDEIVLESEREPVWNDGDLWDVDRLQSLIDALPRGYRTVFVLYVVEGYGHKEIASLLNIGEGTSKSQLSKARKLLQDRLKNEKIVGYGTR